MPDMKEIILDEDEGFIEELARLFFESWYPDADRAKLVAEYWKAPSWEEMAEEARTFWYKHATYTLQLLRQLGVIFPDDIAGTMKGVGIKRKTDKELAR